MEPWKFQPARDRNLSPVERARSIRREAGLLETAGHLVWLTFIKVYLRIFNRIAVTGRENIPRDPPFVLISNHSSHLDAVALAAVLPYRLVNRVFPVAAADVFFESPTGAFFSAFMLNALPVFRKTSGPGAVRELRDRLVEEPCGYILFPEGGRSRDGRLKSFHAGLGIMVAGKNVPIVPCWLTGTFERMPPGRPWPRPGRLGLKVGTPLNFEAVPSKRDGWRRVALECENAVRTLGGLPVVSEENEPKRQVESEA
jgi:1-acyl-sn-glycerol-3-phosphate acyltransferase